MNREILFRGKSVINKKWVEGYYYKTKFYVSEARLFDFITIPHPEIKDRKSDHDMIIPETLGQYTGLTDKNGVKIFEGDIVEYNDGYDYFKGEVTFENGAFGIGCDEIIGISNGCSDNFANLWQLFWNQEVTDEPMLYYCSVIGNVYDDPELLER